MDILETATTWAKAEMLSSSIFILLGVAFVVASFGFWQIGNTDTARAYVIPTLVAGILLVILGAGLLIGSQRSLAGFEAAFTSDAAAFVASEIARAERVTGQYRVAVFLVIPLIVVVCAGLIILLQGPVWRASLITTIALMAVIMLVDSNANARLEVYKDKLLSVRATE